MNNYEYIIASLPLIGLRTNEASLDADAVIEEILSQLSERDLKSARVLLSLYGDETLDEEFYRKALKDPNPFIRKFLKADLDERNAKVEFLNRELGRPEGTDTVVIGEPDEEGLKTVEGILGIENLLEREKALDEYFWVLADSLTELHVFDLDLILGFIVKLKTVDRWLKLDEEKGRELFRKFVEEIRKSKNI